MKTNNADGTGPTFDEVLGPTPHPLSGVMDEARRRPIRHGAEKITCDPESIVRFFLGEVDAEEAEEMSEHFAVCEQCSRKLAALTMAAEISRSTAGDEPQA